jgi:hypothetical protein
MMRFARVPVVVGAVVLSLALAAWAGDEPEPILPDRAGASNDTATVGAGVIQVETGLVYGHERIAGRLSAGRFSAQAAVRWGLTEHLEIGVDGEPFVRMRGPEDDTGHGDLTVNAKYRFLDARQGSWFPSLGLQPFVRLPVAKDPIGSGKTDFGALLLASFTLPGRVDLDVNAGLTAVGQSDPDGHLLQAVAALGLARNVSENVSLFTDLLYASRGERAGGDSVLLDFGVIWRPTRDIALDASFETSPVGIGADWTVRVGVSFRFGR